MFMLMIGIINSSLEWDEEIYLYLICIFQLSQYCGLSRSIFNRLNESRSGLETVQLEA